MTIAEDRRYASLLKEARSRFKHASEADKEQRVREKADLEFYAGDQWPEEVRNARKGQAANAQTGMPAIPARPCLTINKVRQPIQIVTNGERQSEIGVEVIPADDFADAGVVIPDAEIELREGLIRRIQRETNAASARSWAFSRATIAGRGYYAVMTRYLPGKTSDQEVYVHRIFNQDSVRLDPAHEEPDGSDCEYQFMGAWVPWDVYKATYPHSQKTPNRISSASPNEFTSWIDDQPEWVSEHDDQKAVYVVDYYYYEHTSRSLTEFDDGTAEWTDSIPEGDTRKATGTRTVLEKTAKWCKLDGMNDRPLEETEWPSPWLPIIKVLGEELHPYDQDRRAEGMVRPMRDSGEGFNSMASRLVEVVAYAPISPITGPAGFDEGFEEEWDLSTTRSIGRLHYNIVVGPDGQPAPPPGSTPRDAPIAPIAAALQMFDAGIKSTTGVPDPTLGNVDPTLKSGRAIAKLQDQSRMGTSNFMDNLTRSVRHEGRIEDSLLYPIYGQRPGRLARIVTGQGESQPIVIGQPYLMQGKRPQLVTQSPAPQGAKLYTLTPDARFNVMIKVTKNYEARREQQNDVLSQIVGADPAQMGVVGDLLYASMEDLPQHAEMAERAEVMLAPPVQALVQSKKTGQAPIPPQVQQQLDQAKQGVQALMGRVQELEQEKAGKVTEQQGKLAITQAQEAAETERADKDREAKIVVAALAGKFETMQNAMDLLMKEIARIGSQQHDAMLSQADAGHEAGMAAMGTGAAQAASAQDHSQDMNLQSQAAALQPQTPAPNGASA